MTRKGGRKTTAIERIVNLLAEGVEAVGCGKEDAIESLRIAYDLMKANGIDVPDLGLKESDRELSATAILAEGMANDGRKRLINELDQGLIQQGVPTGEASLSLLQRTQAHLRSSGKALEWLEKNPPSGFLAVMETILNSRRGILPPDPSRKGET